MFIPWVQALKECDVKKAVGAQSPGDPACSESQSETARGDGEVMDRVGDAESTGQDREGYLSEDSGGDRGDSERETESVSVERGPEI